MKRIFISGLILALTRVGGAFPGCGQQATVPSSEQSTPADTADRETRSEGYAEVNGTKLYYEVAGRGHPLVLVHAGPLNSAQWNEQFEIFSGYYRVIRYDVRGYGKSALPTVGQPYSHHDDLKGLLDHLGVAQAHVLGLSMGGGIAIDFTLAYPDRVTALVACDSALGGFEWSEQQKTRLQWLLGSLVPAYQEGDMDRVVSIYLEDPIVQPALEKPNLRERFIQFVRDYDGWHLLNPDPLTQLDPPAITRLEEIRAPSLIIAGERDLPDFHAIADLLDARIPNSRKVVIPDSGHATNMEKPESFNKEVLNFLKDL